MQVVINKCFLLNPEKKFGEYLPCCFQENAPLILKCGVTKPKASTLGYSNYQLKSCKQVKEQFQTSRSFETDL